MVGNFIADTVRGKRMDEYPESIREGILLHRFIDTFTDEHPTVLLTRKRLYPHFGKYAAVVQDVFYDHFLAKNWKSHHHLELNEFTAFVYQTLGESRHHFNQRAERTFHFMQSQDWLSNYATEEGIHRSLSGLSRRAKFTSNMEKSIPVLRAKRSDLEEDFAAFFPELVAEVKAGGH